MSTSIANISDHLEEANVFLAETIGLKLAAQPWESEIFNKAFVQVSAINNDWALVRLDEGSRDWISVVKAVIGANAVLTCRVPNHRNNVYLSLSKAGFSVVECYLRFGRGLLDILGGQLPGNVSFFSDERLNEVKGIARRTFSLSRFHLDPRLELEHANASRAQWVENACKGRAEFVLISKDEGRTSGFIIGKRSSEKTCTLDLVGVDPCLKGQGIGSRLVSAFLQEAKNRGFSHAVVGTQSQNIASVRAYENQGFRLTESFFSLHLHI